MDVVAGGSGEEPVIAGPRLVTGLVVLALVLAGAAVLLGVAVWQAQGDEADDADMAGRYGAILAAATAETEAFVNIRYDRAEESIEAVAQGATGDFAEQYDQSTEGVLTVLEENRSVREGEVVWIGVVDADADSATVLAATTGTVANAQTDDEPVARAFRLRLELVLVDGRWLTSDLQFVA